MSVHVRYYLLQLPGWIVAGVILYALHRWLGLPLWAAGLLLAADLAKDILLFPYLRRAYETGEGTGAERLIGDLAEVHTILEPSGYVRIRGELWKARLADADSTVPPGSRVRVRGAVGLVLEVIPEAKAPDVRLPAGS